MSRKAGAPRQWPRPKELIEIAIARPQGSFEDIHGGIGSALTSLRCGERQVVWIRGKARCHEG